MGGCQGTHLVLDALTAEGIPLFWPYRRNIGIPLGGSGGDSRYRIAYCSALHRCWNAMGACAY
ncbi:MAG: metal-dependent hydrolase [Bacillota bacterium]